ncbi:MAG: hypothetical protein KC468_11530 [Myxococcales bacterium]|nr:hypothetical protein [Myxococcales bacterium]
MRALNPRTSRRVAAALLLSLVACEAPSGRERVLDGAAGPCAVDGMLAEETSATRFVDCGVSSTPLTRAAARCVVDAHAQARPFMLRLRAGGVRGLLGPRAALVGAPFDGAFGLRLFTPGGPGEGQSAPVDLVLTTPDDERPALLPSLDGARRCPG